MNQTLRITQWNANGLSERRQEMEVYLNSNKIDIMLISETRYTNSRQHLSIPNYKVHKPPIWKGTWWNCRHHQIISQTPRTAKAQTGLPAGNKHSC